jgi:hypothetical protein
MFPQGSLLAVVVEFFRGQLLACLPNGLLHWLGAAMNSYFYVRYEFIKHALSQSFRFFGAPSQVTGIFH